MSDKFIHFRTQSSYSMLESALKVNQLVELAKDKQMSAVCLADRGNLFASLEFAIEATKHKIQPVHGAILNILFKNKGKDDFAEILLIAKDEAGYKNLLKLVGYTFTKNNRSITNHINFSDIEECAEGIIALSAYNKGVIGKLLLQNSYEQAYCAAKKFKELFGDRFYFEIMRHGYPTEKQIESSYLKIADELELPLLATNQVLFSDIGMHDIHDVLLCISASVVQEEQNRLRVSNQCYFKSAREMIELFSDLPEAIENTVHLAKRCYVMARPAPPALPNFVAGSISEAELLRLEARRGLDLRLESVSLEDRAGYYKRLDYELDIICKMNFPGYFLIVADFIKWSKAQDIAVGPGRGSGAGSIIAWSLQITDLDPIKFGLLFERFLNPERVSMPDFDIDFCQERREEVITYVRAKYGDRRVGQIITFGKMQAKAVIKDVSRVLGLKYAYADYLTELVPFNAITPVTLSGAIEDVKELKQAHRGKGLYNLEGEEELIRQVLNTSLVLEGLHRHASTHAAGIVIANQDLTEIVPIYRDANSDMLIVQYSQKFAELAGLVKFDFLGLQTLTVITKTLGLIRKRNDDINIEKIPYDDKKTYRMLSNGLSTGVFQFESVGMKSALRKLGPDNLDDIIALGALYRPGPMENIPTYIACKHGQQQVDYLHPVLEPTLKSTYGVIIYQEQVMEIAKLLAGYSLGSADLLRKAMGKKVKAEMDAQEDNFVSGAVKNNVPADQARSIFATVAKFAGYGFNKSHASAYGVISYQTAYLKANYPAEFLVACLNLDIQSSDKINIFLQDAQNFDIEIVPPCINKSGGLFDIEYDPGSSKKKIIYALAAIKTVTKNFGNMVAEIRGKYGPFKSVIDFAEKMDPKLLNRRLLENIIKAGCFDGLCSNRNELLQSVNQIMAYNSSCHQEKFSRQFSLISVKTVGNNIINTKVNNLSPSELAYLEFDVLGLFIKNHPLLQYGSVLEKCGIKNSYYLKHDLSEGTSQHKLAGIIVRKDARMSGRGRFVTLGMSDHMGSFEITIYSDDVLQNYANYINIKQSVVVYCDIFKDKGGLRITANRFTELEDEIANIKYNITVQPSNQVETQNVIDFLKHKSVVGKANSKVLMEIKVGGEFVARVDMSSKFYLNDLDRQKLEKFCPRIKYEL